MERGLKAFHETVRSKVKDPELIELLGHLVKAEESHMNRLLAVSLKWGMDPDEIQTFEENVEATVMEGGIDIASFLAKNESFLQSVAGVSPERCWGCGCGDDGGDSGVGPISENGGGKQRCRH
jgi:hypothetical protein